MDEEKSLVTSWDDWFNEAQEMSRPMKQYEDTIKDYYNLTLPGKKDNKKSQDVMRHFARRHTSDFYLDDSVVPSWLILKAIKFSGIGLVAGIVITVILSFVLGMFLTSDNFLYGLFGCGLSEMSDKVIRGVIIGVVIGILCAGGIIGIYILQRKSIIKRLDGLADELEEYLSFIPPKYRNLFCIDAIYEMYANYGVHDFESAVLTLDNHIEANRKIYKPFEALSDVKYAGNQVKGLPDKSYKVGEHDKSNPALPKDIDVHVSNGVENADTALNELIGLEDVKSQVRRLKNRISFYDDSTKDTLGGSNMVFLGPPGTGKTSVARIITKLLYDFGYIPENRIIEIDGDYLKSPYQGQTGERVNAIVDYAEGGVLFIDEAYLLYEKQGGAGAEATGVLLKAMEDKRDSLVIILAGYEDGMERLIASNEGFASRIRHKLRFSDYSIPDLINIFDFFLSKLSGNWSCEDGCYERLEQLFEMEKSSPSFGNARSVRNTLDALLDIHADRTTNGKNPSGTQNVITVGDVDTYVDMRKNAIAEEGHSFLASKHIDESIITLADLKSRTFDGSKNPEKELSQMIGLETVKQELEAMKAQQEFFNGGQTTGHMMFVGPPGVGKTAMASIMTGMLYEMGYIRENKYLSITGDFFRGSFVGHTGKRAEAIVEYSRNMLLFIDEAYLLFSDKHDDSFGAEALGVLIAAMEKYRDEMVVVFAGYTNEMQQLMAGNPGLESRVSNVFHFESYTPKQLCEIFRLMAWKKGFKVDKSMWQPLANHVVPMLQNESFGNARYMRELVDKCIKKHVVRFTNKEISEDFKMILDKNDL